MKHVALNFGVLLGTMLVGLGAGLGAGGCTRVSNIPPDALDDTPIPVDSAMARRDWEQSHAQYAATGIHTTPNLYTFQSQEYSWSRGYSPVFTETPVFLANVVLIPYQIFASPVWGQHEYRAATVPPSYSAMPPLPDSRENQLEAPPAPPAQDDRPLESPTTQPSNG
jgi:hypothetical protein